MSDHWVEYSAEIVRSPLTFWVHREKDGERWSLDGELVPPLPGPVPGEGYRKYFVRVGDFEFRFASLDELRHCIEVLSQELLPRSIDLSAERGSGAGPNSHWLSRLPARMKPWNVRQQTVTRLGRALVAFQRGAEGAPG